MTHAQKERVLESMEKNKTGGWIAGPDGVIEIFEDVSKAIEERIDRRIETKINEFIEKIWDKKEVGGPSAITSYDLENAKFTKPEHKDDIKPTDKELGDIEFTALKYRQMQIRKNEFISVINEDWAENIENKLKEKDSEIAEVYQSLERVFKNQQIARKRLNSVCDELEEKDKEIESLRKCIKFDDDFTIRNPQ